MSVVKIDDPVPFVQSVFVTDACVTPCVPRDDAANAIDVNRLCAVHQGRGNVASVRSGDPDTIVVNGTAQDPTVRANTSGGVGPASQTLATGAQVAAFVAARSLSDFGPPTAALGAGGQRVVDLGAPTAAADAATKAYVDSATGLSGAMIYRGGYNVTTNAPALTGASNIFVAQGSTYTVTPNDGTFLGAAVSSGDLIIANADVPANSSPAASAFTVVNENIGLATGTVAGIASFPTAGGLAVDAAGAVTLVPRAGVAGAGYAAGTLTLDAAGICVGVLPAAKAGLQVTTSAAGTTTHAGGAFRSLLDTSANPGLAVTANVLSALTVATGTNALTVPRAGDFYVRVDAHLQMQLSAPGAVVTLRLVDLTSGTVLATKASEYYDNNIGWTVGLAGVWSLAAGAVLAAEYAPAIGQSTRVLVGTTVSVFQV